MILAAAPDWASIMTAIGTVAVAVVAVAVALFAEWRASKRLTQQQTRHDAEIAEERRLADQRLATQLAHSDDQLDKERTAADARLKGQQEHSDQQFQAEQGRITEREQYAEAYAVLVTMGEITTESESGNEYGDPGPAAVKGLAAMVVNRGRYAITQVTAQFCPDGITLISPRRVIRIPANFESLPRELRGDFGPLRDKRGHSSTLTPWDTGMRVETDEVAVRHLAGPYFVVRWVDRWGTQWEHKQGVVRYLTGTEEWKP